MVAYGFWIFLLSDIVMFAALFASYAVLVRSTAGGPTGAQLFNQATVAIETACLLVSSYTCGLMSLAVNSRRRLGTYLGALITFRTRSHVSQSRDPRVLQHDRHRRDAAAERFSVRILHACRMPRAARRARTDLADRDDGAGGGIRISLRRVQRRLLCFSLFWHALDIVWVGVFTVVYLMGVSP